MKSIKLSERDAEYIKLLVEQDIAASAKDISFYEEMKIKPKDYIDEMISLSNKLGFDFWETIRQNCTEFELKRLEQLYAGKSLSSKAAARKSASRG